MHILSPTFTHRVYLSVPFLILPQIWFISPLLSPKQKTRWSSLINPKAINSLAVACRQQCSASIPHGSSPEACRYISRIPSWIYRMPSFGRYRFRKQWSRRRERLEHFFRSGACFLSGSGPGHRCSDRWLPWVWPLRGSGWHLHDRLSRPPGFFRLTGFTALAGAIWK